MESILHSSTDSTWRMIRLRRPAVVSMQEERFVPSSLDLAGIDRRWRELRERNPASFDGEMLHVLGVHRNGHGGAVIHVAPCSYRFYAVQQESRDLGVRPLGVKGIVIEAPPEEVAEREANEKTESMRPRVLMGRRSVKLAVYGGCWEFAPGGAVEPNDAPDETVLRELREEAELEAISGPTARAVLLDPVARTWELVFELRSRGEPIPRKGEYDELRWCDLHEISRPPQPLSPVAERLRALARAMIGS